MGMTQSIGAQDMTEEHWRILHSLSDERGRSMGELAEEVLMNHPALTKNIDRLVAQGLVHRAADPSDNRKVLVFITDRGMVQTSLLTHGVDAHHSAIEEALGKRKTQQLKRLLEELIAGSSQG
ncbi:MAG: transcriptional regulator, MarR family [Ramlibacter sp.]|nr:transcriptional regulator, MarR family [Ramlibacter sp.]